jgi:hypothetical protein
VATMPIKRATTTFAAGTKLLWCRQDHQKPSGNMPQTRSATGYGSGGKLGWEVIGTGPTTEGRPGGPTIVAEIFGTELIER